MYTLLNKKHYWFGSTVYNGNLIFFRRADGLRTGCLTGLPTFSVLAVTLVWLLLRHVLAADRRSQRTFGGGGGLIVGVKLSPLDLHRLVLLTATVATAADISQIGVRSQPDYRARKTAGCHWASAKTHINSESFQVNFWQPNNWLQASRLLNNWHETNRHQGSRPWTQWCQAA